MSTELSDRLSSFFGLYAPSGLASSEHSLSFGRFLALLLVGATLSAQASERCTGGNTFANGRGEALRRLSAGYPRRCSTTAIAGGSMTRRTAGKQCWRPAGGRHAEFTSDTTQICRNP